MSPLAFAEQKNPRVSLTLLGCWFWDFPGWSPHSTTFSYFAPALLPTAQKWKIVWWQIFIEYISAIDDKDLLFGYFCRNLIKRKRTECDNWANEEETKRWHERMLRVEQKSQIRDRGCIARPSARRRRSI